MLGGGQRIAQQVGEQFAEGGGIHGLAAAELDAGKEAVAGVLADQVEQVVARSLDKFGAEKNVVVDVVHANGKRTHRQGDVVAFQRVAVRVRHAEVEKSIGHTAA